MKIIIKIFVLSILLPISFLKAQDSINYPQWQITTGIGIPNGWHKTYYFEKVIDPVSYASAYKELLSRNLSVKRQFNLPVKNLSFYVGFGIDNYNSIWYYDSLPVYSSPDYPINLKKIISHDIYLTPITGLNYHINKRFNTYLEITDLFGLGYYGISDYWNGDKTKNFKIYFQPYFWFEYAGGISYVIYKRFAVYSGIRTDFSGLFYELKLMYSF